VSPAEIAIPERKTIQKKIRFKSHHTSHFTSSISDAREKIPEMQSLVKEGQFV
jgi:hypothetical protein